MNQAFYAIGKTRVPLRAGCIGLLTNPLCCYLLMPRIGAMALTLSYSITSILQMTVLCCVYYSYKNIRPKGMLVFLLKSGLSLAIMLVVINFISSYTPAYQGKIYELAYLAGMFMVALVIYFGCSLLFKVQESRDAIQKLRNNLRKSH